MNRDVIRQVVNVVTLVVMIAVNALANILPINGLTTAEISDSFPVFFVPAGYVFSIWGLIYVGLTAFMIYQALPAQRENPRLLRIGYLFALSSIANTAWILFWHYQQFPLTLVAMFTLLLSLIAIYMQLDIGRTAVSGTQKWLVNVPFSIYLGWITVATIANVTMALYDAQWNGFGIAPESWAMIMLVVGTVVASLVIMSRRDVAYTAVIVWAFIGIVVKQYEVSNVALTAGIMTAVVIAVLLFKLVLDRGGSGRLTARSA